MAIASLSSVISIVPWSSLNWGGPCPIRYPFSNETRFCKSVGRQRAVIAVEETGAQGTACVQIPWRRRDDPSGHGIFVTGSANISLFLNASVVNTSRITGTVCFAADGRSSLYVVYYYPFEWSFDGGSGSYHSRFLTNTSAGPLLAPATPTLHASCRGLEAYSSFDARSPMELVASPEEIAALPKASYLTWTSRIVNTTTQSVRMPELPSCLAQTAPNTSVALAAAPGSVAVIQVVLYASSSPIKGVGVEFGRVGSIAPSAFTCLQTEGVDYMGNPSTPPPVSIARGEAAALLVLVTLPTNISCGTTHTGSFWLRPSGLRPTRISLTVQATCRAVEQSGPPPEAASWGLSWLGWLNSQAGNSPSQITRPYVPISLEDESHSSVLCCRGRTVGISTSSGLPARVESNARSVLASPLAFDVFSEDGSALSWQSTSTASVSLRHGGAEAAWSSEASAAGILAMHVDGAMAYDGHMDLSVTLTAAVATHLKHASLRLALPRSLVRFANGAGFGDDGGWFPAGNTSALAWRWASPFGPGGGPAGNPVKPAGWRLWLGDVDAGLYLKLKGTDRSWNRAGGGENAPGSKVPAPPRSWGGGGINVSLSRDGSTVEVDAYSGPLALAAGESVVFNFSVMVTPVKGDYTSTPEGKIEHYKGTRHYHVPYGQWNPPTGKDLAKAHGINTVILHQSNRLNPYIDWPFHPSVVPALREYVDDARAAGVATKLYYTVGQISNHAVDLFGMASLNGEVLLRNMSDQPPKPGTLGGMGGDLMGNEWLEEHMVRGYKGGWFTMNPGGDEDASIGDNTTSRFMNYYIEGQRFLYDEVGISGLYYDGFGAERQVQQRIRRMSADRGAKFDVHGRAFQNTELLPFVDSMWTCEGIDFTQGPAYWLISIAALPFGVFGEMLGADNVLPTPGTFCGESCASKWRGMLFGMSNRAGWTGADPNDNAGLWRLWDAFGIEQADMWGWWNASAPVSTGRQDVLATAYVRRGTGTLVALASWSTSAVNVSLHIDWAALGLSSDDTDLVAPELPSYNRAASALRFPSPTSPVEVPPLQGWLLLLQPPQGRATK